MWEWLTTQGHGFAVAVFAIITGGGAWYVRGLKVGRKAWDEYTQHMLRTNVEVVTKQAEEVEEWLPSIDARLKWGDMKLQSVHKDPKLRAEARAWLKKNPERP